MTPDERAALVSAGNKLRAVAAPPGSIVGMIVRAADLLEADRMLLALAEAYLAERPHSTDCPGVFLSGTSFARPCTCWKAKYDAAKKALS